MYVNFFYSHKSKKNHPYNQIYAGNCYKKNLTQDGLIL